jgi:hypothetical protein
MAMAAAEPARFVVVDGRAEPDAIARRVLRAVEPLFDDLDRDDAATRPDEPKRPGVRIS